jgi:sterol 3beta-glucosyltransferase
MKVLVISFGSLGDVQPYVALGKGLKKAGHEVTVCTAAQFEDFVREQGLDYGYMTGELLELLDTDAGKDALEDTVGLFGTIKTMIKLVRRTNPLNNQMMFDSWAVAEKLRPDVILYNSKALGAVHIAEKFDIPAVLALPQPMVVPTGEYPTIGMPKMKIGAWYNRLTYKLVEMGYKSYGGMVNKFRQEALGLEKFPGSAGLLTTADGNPIPVLHAFSEQVVSRPADWPENAHICGYWFLERDDDWQPPDTLVKFLDKGDAPIYVGFGSMAGRDPLKKARMVIEAMQAAGVRGVIATGWGGMQVDSLPETVYLLDNAPHDWLFPRMAAVVHHGGAGTTAAGLYAGRATLICPFMGDQPYWGDLVFQLGVGVKPIPQKKMTVDNLTVAFRELAVNKAIQEKAADLGENVSAEDSIANTVALIEKIVGEF